MGKLVIKVGGKQIGEVNLKLGDTKIGRKPECDIVLNDPGVSAEHALITTVGMKSSIQDLNSRNGTFVENDRVKQRELRHGETITVGRHTLIYREEMNLDTPAFGKRPATATPAPPPALQNRTLVLTAFAQFLAIEGRDKGKQIPLIKEIVTLDNPGKNPARVTRTSGGYLLEAKVGPGEPRINDKPVPPSGQILEKGDIVEIAGTKYQFFK